MLVSQKLENLLDNIGIVSDDIQFYRKVKNEKEYNEARTKLEYLINSYSDLNRCIRNGILNLEDETDV